MQKIFFLNNPSVYTSLKKFYDIIIIIDDFNIKTETIKEGKSSMGKFVIGKRNERGKMLVTFSDKYKNMAVMNIFYQNCKGAINGLGKA